MKGRDVETYDTLNDVLVNLFRDINDIEEKAITSYENKDLTSNDMHVIHAIGVGTKKNMSSIAKELSVTVGTLTISMNSLVKKAMWCGAAAQRTGGWFIFHFLKKESRHTSTISIFMNR